MQALSDEQQIKRLEAKVDRLGQDLETKVSWLDQKMDARFATIRSENRADFRLLLGVLLSMFATMILGFAGILLQHL
jgi:hypothetical protein